MRTAWNAGAIKGRAGMVWWAVTEKHESSSVAEVALELAAAAGPSIMQEHGLNGKGLDLGVGTQASGELLGSFRGASEVLPRSSR